VRGVSIAALVVASFLLGGCETASYYAQAVGGQMSLLYHARSIDNWLADPATPPELRARLQSAQRIRDFASSDLGLPNNGSYHAYADLGRPYVVWNVYAAGELSVEAKSQCFPVAGCVSYRGFFHEEDARHYAERIRAEGYDVYVAGVAAYSTLGWFDDPLLSTFIQYPDTQLARLLFHELAHQLIYTKDDTMFNESFAVVVEEEGVRRWLNAEGRGAELEKFRALQVRRREFATRVKQARERLQAIYGASLTREQKLEQKKSEFDRLRADYGNFIPAEPNNGFLVSIALYTELVPALERELAASNGDIGEFYKRAGKLARLSKDERQAALVPK
jgi:predicted aminopeptidase